MTVIRSPISPVIFSPLREPTALYKGGGGVVPLSLTADGTEMAPLIIADLERSSYYWGGSAKTISDLTADGDGYYMSTLTGLDTSTIGFTAMVEWDQQVAPGIVQNAPQCVFSMSRAVSGALRFDVSLRSQNTVNDAVRGQPQFGYGGNAGFSTYNPLLALPHDTDIAPMLGRKRAMISIKPGEVPWVASDGYQVTQPSGGAVAPVVSAFDRFNIGFRRIATTNDRAYTGGSGTISVRVWNFPATKAQMELAMAASLEDISPIHILGDSFGNGDHYENGGGLVSQIRLAAQSRGYAMFSDDVAGGTSLAQQAVRFAAYPRYWNSTLLPLEIGLDGTGLAFADALDDIRSMLRHDRWLVFEPIYDTNKRVGSGARTALDGYVADIQAHLTAIGKSDRWVPTKAGMQAAARVGNATDDADIADDIWPRDTTYWSTDGLHNRPAADVVLADIIVNAVIAKGWL